MRKILEQRLENARNDYGKTTREPQLELKGQIEAYQDCLDLIPAPRTEQEILKDFESLGYAIIKNDEYRLILVNEWNHIIEIDKACKRYQCYYYTEYTNQFELSTYIDIQEHKLLNELFEVWQWI